MTAPNVLIIDDETDAALSLVRALKTSLPDVRFHSATTEGKALEIFSETHAQVAVMDLQLDVHRGVESGFALVQKILTSDPTVRIIVLTGHSSVEHGVRALSVGAANFLEKPANIPHLTALISDALAQSDLRRAYRALNKNSPGDISSVIRGVSPKIQQVREAVVYAAQTLQSVLLLGETGTGKGLCARAIHQLGKRRQKKFVRYQPTFASADLVNSDLFGHTKGAFTGAQADRAGLISEAQGGTLFLDEVEALPVETQVSLLGALQEKRIRRVGSDLEVPVDFRLISASNADPEKAMLDGSLRRDFYHRAAYVTLTVPPLRERLEDILDLSSLVLENLRQSEQASVYEIRDDALGALRSYSWPGNVRELEACVEGGAYRAQFAGRSFIVPEDLTIGLRHSAPHTAGFHERVEAYKISLIEDALRASAGNQVQAAKILGLDRSSLRRILERKAG
jgi:DNA-binding NtrC family response regulator